MRRSLTLALVLLPAVSLALHGQAGTPHGHAHTPGMTHGSTDSAHAAMKARGATAMGVDQDKATHRFDSLADGGRIELQSDLDDSVAIAGIRAHFKDIESAFRSGDYSIPMFVHDGPVPGTGVMQARKDRIEFVRRDLPKGAELRLRTTDRAAIDAIHQFMAFQRKEHGAGGIP
jgi:hypothetical protein